MNATSLQPPSLAAKQPLISIVICTCNRAEMLRECLESLIIQEHEGFDIEIVVVNNGSTDATAEAIESCSRHSAIPLRGVFEGRRGQVQARMAGLAAARGEWIANFDDDQIAEPDWLQNLFDIAREKNAHCVGGALFLRLPADCSRGLSHICRRMLGESVGWTTPAPYTRKHGPGSGNQMIHRSVFDEIGSYDESYQLRGYDTDLYRRMRAAGVHSWFTPHARAWHITPAYRLTRAYFEETALHNGWSFCRRDLADWGLAAALAIASARWAQVILLRAPRYLWHVLTRADERALGMRCLIWRAEGYLRCALCRISPRIFSQRRFFALHEFRAEHARQETIPSPQAQPEVAPP